jgi:hypothetical protein
MDLSIIIVNWNTCQLLAQCLNSLQATAGNVNPAAQAVTFGTYLAEVYVVDNASQDDSVAMTRERFPWARLIVNDQNVGFALANNQAFAASIGRYVLLLNSDTEVWSGAIESMLAFMESDSQSGAIGARLLNADGSLQSSCQPMLTPWREFWRLIFLDRIWRRATYRMEAWDVHTPRPVETIKGACLLVRRAALAPQEPLLDGQYFMYTEEVDLCCRLSQAKWRLYWVPEARVTHFGEASSRQAYTAMYVQLYRSKVQFYRKFGGEPRARQFKRLVRLAYLPRLWAARAAALIRPATAPRVQTIEQLLAELPHM